MIKDKLQKIIHYLPKSIQKVILSYYNSIGFRKAHINRTHQLDFPITSVDGSFNFHRPLFGNKFDEGYFTQYYEEPEIPQVFLTIDEKLSLKTETLYGKLYAKGQSITLNIKSESILPVSLIKKNFEGSFLDNKASINLQINAKKIQLEGLAINRFHYLPIPENTSLKINSNYDLIIGDPLVKKNDKEIKNKLTLVLFIDGFAAEIFKKEALENLMPNTYKFFKEGVIFNKCHATAEWTLPSFASIFSGKYLGNHKIYHPEKGIEIGKDYPILNYFFKDIGYMTFMSGGNWRGTPSYGYCKKFDRTIYMHTLQGREVIVSFTKHLKSFKGRSHFCWLTFMDLHHDFNLIPSIDEEVNLPLAIHSYKKEQVKTPFLTYSENGTKRYIERIRSLDYNLKEVYDYILENFKNEEILVALVSDHGHGYIDQGNGLLAEKRVHVPLMVRGGSIKPTVTDEIIQNIDLLPILLHLNNIKLDLKSIDGVLPKIFGGIGRKFSFFQSRFPGQTYKARIADMNHEFYFESKSPVDKEGKPNLNDYTIKLFDISSGKEIEDTNGKIKKYIDIIVKHNDLQ